MTTGRRRAGDFDSLLEQWARWLAVPDSVRLGLLMIQSNCLTHQMSGIGRTG